MFIIWFVGHICLNTFVVWHSLLNRHLLFTLRCNFIQEIAAFRTKYYSCEKILSNQCSLDTFNSSSPYFYQELYYQNDWVEHVSKVLIRMFCQCWFSTFGKEWDKPSCFRFLFIWISSLLICISLLDDASWYILLTAKECVVGGWVVYLDKRLFFA